MNQAKVAIVGAGPAGLGCAVLLKQMGIAKDDLAILETNVVGSSFERWPNEMRMITPSFPSNGYHQTDLNAITPDTSPAFSLGKEHPSGAEYAAYLRSVAAHYELGVREHTRVDQVTPQDGDGFVLTDGSGNALHAQYLIWAGGEFARPRLTGFSGSELCQHNSQVGSWDDCRSDHYAVIGSYESGVDAAFNLAIRGKRVTLLDANSGRPDTFDPSRVLSPYTMERLASMANMELVELEQGFRVDAVRAVEGGYDIRSTTGKTCRSVGVPINCTGFEAHLGPVAALFETAEDGSPRVNKYDESTRHRNLFLTGSRLVHGNVVLCFIYKFRGRFVAPCSIIAAELELDTAILDHYQQAGMVLDDFSCCESQQCYC
ncbi:MAG: NAD(P)-binding domain-containing protein [Pseudomonadota bacterium]